MSVPVLGYWPFRGLGQSVRYCLVYAGLPYKNHVYEIGPAPGFKNDWLDDRRTMGFFVPDLPYLLVDGLKITNSHAIMRHISRKVPELHLDGRTEEQKVKVDIIYPYFVKIGHENSLFIHNQQTEKQTEAFTKKTAGIMKNCEAIIGDNAFTCGDELTNPDFVLYEHLHRVEVTFPGILSKHPVFQRYMENFEKIPAIQEHMASPEFQAIKLKHNAPYASRGTGMEK